MWDEADFKLLTFDCIKSYSHEKRQSYKGKPGTAGRRVQAKDQPHTRRTTSPDQATSPKLSTAGRNQLNSIHVFIAIIEYSVDEDLYFYTPLSTLMPSPSY